MEYVWRVIGPVFLFLLGIVSWTYKTKLKEIDRNFREVRHDIEILQEKLFEVDRKGIIDNTTIVGMKSDILRLEREVGKVDGSLTRLHQRIDELKDLIYQKMGK